MKNGFRLIDLHNYQLCKVTLVAVVGHMHNSMLFPRNNASPMLNRDIV